jgi:hypothetical protein
MPALVLAVVLGQATVLAEDVAHAWPKYLNRDTALVHVDAAMAASTHDLPPELLLAIAHLESHFHRDDVSRKDGRTGKRITGRWPSSRRGRSFVAPYFCGPLQAKAYTWARCLELQDPFIGYAAGVAEIERWLARTHGNVDRALAGHGCGNAGLKHGCKRYASRVRARLRRLHAAAARARRTLHPPGT